MAINPQINDMAWFGKPADPVGSFQKGMNLAEQKQRMKQSADMHPLKMADLQSATAARDANTNLSKQSYRFNELTEADRVSSVNALSRLQQVSAGIAENTQEAVESLKKSQAWNQKRSDKITKKVDIELEVQAREAERNRVITNQWVNEQTKQGQVDQFNQRTNLLSQQVRTAQLQNDVNYANKTLLTEARGAALQNQLNNFEALQYQYGQEQAGRQPLQESMLTMNALANAGRYDELDSLTLPQGLTPAQKKQWQDHRSAVKNSKAGMDYENAVKASTANQVQTITGAQEYAGKIAEMGLGTIDANGVLQIDPKNLERVNRYTEQRKLLDQMQGDETKALMDALGATNEMDVFGAPAGGLGGGAALLDPSKGMSLKGMASMHGTRHGDDILLSDQGLRRLRNIVTRDRADIARQTQSRVVSNALAEFGGTVTGMKLGADGKLTFDIERLGMDSQQQATAIQARFDSLLKQAQDSGEDLTGEAGANKIRQMELDAIRGVMASTLPVFDNAAQARASGGISDGDKYIRRGHGIRIVGQPDDAPVNDASRKAPPQDKPKMIVTHAELKGYDASNDVLMGRGGWDDPNEMSKAVNRGNREVWEYRDTIYADLTKFTNPAHAREIIKRGMDTKFFRNDWDVDDPISELVEQVDEETDKKWRQLSINMVATAYRMGGTLEAKRGDEIVNASTAYDLLSPFVGKPASSWPSNVRKWNPELVSDTEKLIKSWKAWDDMNSRNKSLLQKYKK